MAAHPTFFLIRKLGSSSDSHIVELPGYLPAYSPYVFYREQSQSLVSPLFRINETAALISLVFLGEFRTDFCQSLRFCDSDGDRDAHGSEHISRNPGSISVEERFVIRRFIIRRSRSFLQIFPEE